MSNHFGALCCIFLRGVKMKSSTKDKVSGAFHELKGKVKETAGKATGNPRLKAEGQDEKVSGKIQKKVGQVEKVIGK
jgi:uncharacterized protein YjbJ (UPF0337 family)